MKEAPAFETWWLPKAAQEKTSFPEADAPERCPQILPAWPQRPEGHNSLHPFCFHPHCSRWIAAYAWNHKENHTQGMTDQCTAPPSPLSVQGALWPGGCLRQQAPQAQQKDAALIGLSHLRRTMPDAAKRFLQARRSQTVKDGSQAHENLADQLRAYSGVMSRA